MTTEPVTDASNVTVIEDYEDTNSTDATVDEDIKNMFANIHRISPFLLAVVGGGIMLSVLICTVLALVVRINMRRRMKTKRKVMKNANGSVGSGCGGFEQPPYLGLKDPVRVNSSRFTHRSVTYPSQYRKVDHTRSIFPPITTAQTRSPKQPYYPVVTPSSTFQPKPYTQHPTPQTAGLYQTRLRNPRPVSCMAGVGLDYLPKAGLSNPPVVPPTGGRGYMPHIPPPLQARFERDYMSIAEVEQSDNPDIRRGESFKQGERRGSVYI